MVELSTLVANPRNPRKIAPAAFAKLCRSIQRDKRFMELRPIVVDDDRVIIGGNQRYRALLELGYKKVPVEWVKVASGLTKPQRDRFILLDNSPEGASGFWDFGLLLDTFKIEVLEDIGFLLPQEVDLSKEWQGMPAFDQPEQGEYKKLNVRFATRADYERFQELIGQQLTDQTRDCWFPKAPDFDSLNRDYEYGDSA